jgi:hypothetical protein
VSQPPNTPAEDPRGLRSIFLIFAIAGVVAAVILVVSQLT